MAKTVEGFMENILPHELVSIFLSSITKVVANISNAREDSYW